MFRQIACEIISVYMPEKEEKWMKAYRLFQESGYHVTSSHATMKDGSIILGFEIYEAFVRLSRAIDAAQLVTEVEYEQKEYVSNWPNKLPSWMMNYKKGQEQGQAKIFESVLTAVQSFKDQKKMRILVIGSGMVDQGLSYPAIAEVLTDRGCAGEMILTDPLNENKVKVVRDFKLTYKSTFDVPVGKFDVILDDSFPPTLTGEQIKRAVDAGAIVSTKSHLDKLSWNNEPTVAFRFVPGVGMRICAQPYYDLREVRAVYGYKKPKEQVCASQCHCSDCWKIKDRGRTDLEWYELVKMGIRPCFPYPGKNYVRELAVAMSDDVMSSEFVWHKISENHQKHFHEFLAYYKRDTDAYCRQVESRKRRLFGYFVRSNGEVCEEIVVSMLPIQTPSRDVARQIEVYLPKVVVERRGFLFRVKKKKLGVKDGVEENPGPYTENETLYGAPPGPMTRLHFEMMTTLVGDVNHKVVALASMSCLRHQDPVFKIGMKEGIEENPGPPRCTLDLVHDCVQEERDSVELGTQNQFAVSLRLGQMIWLRSPIVIEQEFEDTIPDLEPILMTEEERVMLRDYEEQGRAVTGASLDHEDAWCMCSECNVLRRGAHGQECECAICVEMRARYAMPVRLAVDGHESDCECQECDDFVTQKMHFDALLEEFGYHSTVCICSICYGDGNY